MPVKKRLMLENDFLDPNTPTGLMLASTFVTREQTMIGVDPDGVPFFADGLTYQEAYPIRTDPDGIPYIETE